MSVSLRYVVLNLFLQVLRREPVTISKAVLASAYRPEPRGRDRCVELDQFLARRRMKAGAE